MLTSTEADSQLTEPNTEGDSQWPQHYTEVVEARVCLLMIFAWTQYLLISHLVQSYALAHMFLGFAQLGCGSQKRSFVTFETLLKYIETVALNSDCPARIQ